MPPFDAPARDLHGGSECVTDARARPNAPAQCSPLLAARPELTTAIPTHPCHAAFLPCRISSASPPAEPLHRTSIAQSHAVARAGAGDSSPHGSSHAALVAHVAPHPTHPINVAPLPCRPCAAPPPVPSFHTAADWLPQATAHVPARSGRQQIHAGERASGGASHPNRGIGRGYALGTALAQADFRESTTVCASPECAALIDEHWLRRSSHRAYRGNAGKHIRYQLEMADALESGRRRLTVWVEEDGHLHPTPSPQMQSPWWLVRPGPAPSTCGLTLPAVAALLPPRPHPRPRCHPQSRSPLPSLLRLPPRPAHPAHPPHLPWHHLCLWSSSPCRPTHVQGGGQHQAKPWEAPGLPRALPRHPQSFLPAPTRRPRASRAFRGMAMCPLDCMCLRRAGRESTGGAQTWAPASNPRRRVWGWAARSCMDG